MGKRTVLSIYNMVGDHLCTLFDSKNIQDGYAKDIKITKELNGWKTVTMSIPMRDSRGERNWRIPFLKNENMVVVTEDDKKDVYCIKEPSEIHDASNLEVTLTCNHISEELKAKNLYKEFDDTNGIGTCEELITRALKGSGWKLSVCDTFYESDGETQKIRSYTCSTKTGAYKMISEICELFSARPIYHGDDRTVEIRNRVDSDGWMEICFGKNADKIQRTSDSSNLITRLYVEGEYGDYGYVGIDSVNPTGLSFILNFDYYKDLGFFTDTHQEAVDKYLSEYKETVDAITSNTSALLKHQADIMARTGTLRYVYFLVTDGKINKREYILGPGATQEDTEIQDDAQVAVVKPNGEYTYQKFGDMTLAGAAWVVRFIPTITGTLAAVEDKIEAIAEGAIGSADEYIEIQKTQMLEVIGLITSIKDTSDEIDNLQKQQEEIEDVFCTDMGTMLRDGYWSDDQYTVGMESELYNDALEISKKMAYPVASYVIATQNLRMNPEHEDEIFKLAQACHIYDKELRINDYCYISKTIECPDKPESDSVSIESDMLDIGNKTFASMLERIADMAEKLRQNKEIYERAASISKEGKFRTGMLEGAVDTLTTKLLSTQSNWSTDEKGNIIFVALDESNAMMLCGNGFMIADGKKENGDWDWRTFGTGEGFTADMIITGYINAKLIEAQSITVEKLASDTGALIDLSENKTVTVTAEKINEVADKIDLSGNTSIKITSGDQITAEAAGSIDLSANDTVRITSADQITAEAASSIDLSANDTVSISSERLQAEIGKADFTVNDSFNVLATSVQEATEDIASLEQRVTEAETGISANADAIELRATKSEVNALGQRVSNAESTITQQAEQIQSKVSQTEFNALEGRMQTAETSITQTADQIELMAGRINDVESDITTTVKTVDVEYYLSNSSTQPVGGSWSTVAPQWVDGKYMWSRTTTILQDGTVSHSNVTCIAGAKGATGAAGNGVSSIVEEFYLSTSKTTQTGGSWQSTMPTWTKGKYVWTRSKITYTNGSTTYTEPYCDTGWEAANDAQDIAEEAMIHTGENPPAYPIPDGKKWVDTSNNPWQFRSWLGADVPNTEDYLVAMPAAGKNLFRSLPDVYSFGGVSLYSDGNGGSVVYGTSESVWVCNTFGSEGSTIPYYISTKDVSFTLSGGSANVGVAVIYQKPDGTNVLQYTSGTGAKTFTLPAGAAILRTYIRVDAGVQVNYETVRPQLEIGASATSYAVYTPAKGVSVKNSKGELRIAELIASQISSKSNSVLTRPTGVTLRVSGDDSLTYGGGYFYAGGNVIENAPFELGGISNVDGSEFDNAYRIRSGFIPLPDALIPGVYLRPNPPDEFAFVGAFFYDAAKRFLGASNANAIGGGYMRLVFRGSGDEAISQTFAESASSSIQVYVDAFGGLRGAEDQVRITSDGEVIETRRTGCLILDGVRRRVAASALTAAEGVTAYGVSIPGASALQDFPADCSHFRIINRMAAESRRVAGTMCTGTTSEGAAYLWIFVNNSDLESTNNWLKAQAEAGTPVTVIYRLASERSRTIGRAQPITPPIGDSTLATDATINHAVLQCSGWEIINDTAEIESALGEAQLGVEEAQEAANQVYENLERRIRLDSSGLHVGDSQTNNELLMQSALIHFVINGQRVSTIASDYHRFGNMEIRTPSSAGGIVIQAVQ